jgi:putative thioredoxin
MDEQGSAGAIETDPIETTEVVVDVGDADFERVVIEGSRDRPVVVDLWASWCAPCRTLGPILEKVARERGGAFRLAKVDVDASGYGQALLQAVRSQGIPTVVAFRDGEPVNMFIGAYPEPEVNRFIDAVLPSEAERAAAEAQQEEEAGDVTAAEAGYRQALSNDPGNVEAAVGLARILAERGQDDEARALAEPHRVVDAGAAQLIATLEVRSWAALADEADPLVGAKRAAAGGRSREALDAMLSVLEDGEHRDQARDAIVTVLTALGNEHELVPEYRRRLTNALF